MPWKPETFDVALASGPRAKAGYTYRGLGLWMRDTGSPKGRKPPVWSLTHLGSGHCVVELTGKVAVAFPVATEIAEAGDWEFISLVGYKDRFPDVADRLMEIISRHSKVTKRIGQSPLSLERGLAIAQQIASNRP